MPNFFPSRRRPSKQKRFLLLPEALEDRTCPADLAVSLDAVVQMGHQVHLSGYVTGESVGVVSVTFSGAVNDVATTDATGYFSLTTTSASLGTVYAHGIDEASQETDTAAAEIAVAAPTVSLSVTNIDNNLVTLQGHVESIDEAALSVALGGILFDTPVVDGNGDFSLTVPVSQVGDISATTTDLWSQMSNTAVTTVSSNGPVIDSFSATYVSDTTWTFHGHVTDEDPEGLTVTLGGLWGTNGVTAIVQADGSFAVDVALYPGETGTATAQTSDWFGQQSNLATHVLPPVITSVYASVNANHEAVVSGWLMGYDFTNVVVSFSGAVSGSLTVEPWGSFCFMTTEAQLGDVYISVLDQNQQPTNTVSTPLSLQAPQMTMWVTSVTGNEVMLQGHVYDVDNSLTVTLGGTVNQTVQSDNDGNFTITVTPAQLGGITAFVTNQWGLVSETVEVPVNSDVPYIFPIDFVRETELLYTFSGQIYDETPEGMTIWLSGCSASGEHAFVNADGTWSLSVVLQAEDAEATLSFVTTDAWGQQSGARTVCLA